MRFGSQEGTLARVFATQEGSLSCFNQPRGQFIVFCQPRGHLSVCFGSQEGTLAHVFATKEGTLARVFAIQEGSLSCFNQPRGQFIVFCQPRRHLSVCFGSQEDILARVLAPRRAL